MKIRYQLTQPDAEALAAYMISHVPVVRKQLQRATQTVVLSVAIAVFIIIALTARRFDLSVTKICGRLSSEARFTPSRRRNSDSRSSAPQFLVTLNLFLQYS